MPDYCLLCRENGEKEEMLKEKMRLVKERMDAEVRALEGLRVLRMSRGLGAFGGLFCRSGNSGGIATDDFGSRVDERRRIWDEESRRLEQSIMGGRCEW